MTPASGMKSAPSACSAFPSAEAKPRARASASSNQSSGDAVHLHLGGGDVGPPALLQDMGLHVAPEAGHGMGEGSVHVHPVLDELLVGHPRLARQQREGLDHAGGSRLLEGEALDAVRVLALDADEPGGSLAAW